MKINIIKIWSASLMCDNHKVKTEVVKKLSKDVSGIINETNQRFIIVSSWAVEYWIALYKNEWIDYTTLEKADLAQAWQSELMNMWTREFKTYWL